ncbi:WD40 repeat-containing protein [Tanacetum coccineum]
MDDATVIIDRIRHVQSTVKSSVRHNASAAFGKPADYFCPKHLLVSSVGITGLAFSDQSELVSYSKESIYQMETKQDPLLFEGHRNYATVKGVGFFGPKCEYVVSGSGCGRVFIWRNKDAKLVRVIEADKQLGCCIEAHPRIPILASSGIDTDIKIWTPTALERATPRKIIEKISFLTIKKLVIEAKTSWMYRRVSPRRSNDDDSEDEEATIAHD